MLVLYTRVHGLEKSQNEVVGSACEILMILSWQTKGLQYARFAAREVLVD
jgi:hypothetical protein